MASFLIHNRHQAAECPVLYEEYEAMGGVPALLRGHEYFCTCPTGDHGAYVVVEGASADEVLAMLPPKYRAGTRVIAGQVLELQYASSRISPAITREPARNFGGSIASTASAASPSTIT